MNCECVKIAAFETIAMDSARNLLGMNAHPTCEIVIPARLASTRLPEKLLLAETGKTVLQHTYERACEAKIPSRVTIAVDDPRMEAAAKKFGANVVMTSSDLQSGTDRIAEVASQQIPSDIYINVQGDEPEIEPDAIDQLAQLLSGGAQADIATLATPIRNRESLEDPACVKVVRAADGHAMYFSRSPIPHARCWDDELLQSDPPLYLQHIGVYAYRRKFLSQLSELPCSQYESAERLEQLRFLEAGAKIAVGTVASALKGIDTADDYRAFVHRYYSRSRLAA
jgi:3-deoxy-manno-octulosonate cytidylyltransferase (CMP-KDO synthetase)